MAYDSKRVRLLAGWYGLYQAVHVPVNVRALFLLTRGDTLDFPAPPPSGGWSDDTIAFFTGMAALDLVNAVLALVFVAGLLARRGWAGPLGLVTLTASIYAALLFDYATYAAGAWQSSGLAAYLFINVAFVPAVVLYVDLLRTALRGRSLRCRSSGPDDQSQPGEAPQNEQP